MKKVSVFLITYNHEKYIAQCIDSIVSQKTDFEFDVVIGEDFSKDSTRAICEQYASRYPTIITLLPSDKNYGPMENAMRTWEACNGKYVAMCEGDDYWIDPLKLQKQADFLDAHDDFSMCFSAVDEVKEGGVDYPDIYGGLTADEYTIEDIITATRCIIPTATLFYRNILPRPLPAFFINSIVGDIPLHLLLADKGKIKYFKHKTAAYRHHGGGISKSADYKREGDDREFLLYSEANKYFEYRYDKAFRKQLSYMAKTMLIFGSKDKKGISKLKHYLEKMPNYLKYSDGINLKELAYYHTLLFFPFLLRFFKKTE